MPLALAIGTGRRMTSLRLLAAGALCSGLPDLDSIGFWAGVPYAHPFGHRGFTHSLFFAAVVGLLACAAAPQLRASRTWAFAFVALSTASHGLLDTFTNGGLGIALLSPFSNHRFFAPWRPIPVSPIGVHGLASSRGLSLFAAELLLVWLPCLTLGAFGFLARNRPARAAKAVGVALAIGAFAAPAAAPQAGAPASGLAIARAAAAQVGVTLLYDPSYQRLDYPGGDVPRDRGVCSDVVVRALREVGVDLQVAVHEDMRRHFRDYPQLWGLRGPDRNIDHRRVPNLMRFFERQGKRVAPGAGYRAGDIVAWRLPNDLLHVGIVAEQRGARDPLMIHNIGRGAQLEDVLRAFDEIGHYRW